MCILFLIYVKTMVARGLIYKEVHKFLQLTFLRCLNFSFWGCLPSPILLARHWASKPFQNRPNVLLSLLNTSARGVGHLNQIDQWLCSNLWMWLTPRESTGVLPADRDTHWEGRDLASKLCPGNILFIKCHNNYAIIFTHCPWEKEYLVGHANWNNWNGIDWQGPWDAHYRLKALSPLFPPVFCEQQ